MNESAARPPMFDTPVDAWYVWVGLAVASGAALAVATAIPAAAPPDATGAANTVDRVAASQHPTVAEHPLPGAEALRMSEDTLGLRGPGGTAHATIGHGPVTPAVSDHRLGRVLEGDPPERHFDSPEAFGRVATAARAAEPVWEPIDRLTVRRVTWEDVDVVLAG